MIFVNIGRFAKETASLAHGGSILASDFLPPGVSGPFGSAWGYLEAGKGMNLDSHPTYEIYVIFKGTATMVVGDDTAQVGPGDIIDIPPNAGHKLICDDEEPLLWAALWWTVA